MGNKLLLIDVDGVLLDKKKLWSAIGKQFETRFPDRSSNELQSFYRTHKGDKPSVDNVIEAGLSVYGPDFWKPFYEVDFRSLLTPGWEELKTICQQKEIEPCVFSEGSIGRRFWMPDYVKEGFQPYKVEQLKLGVPALVFQDKLAELPARVLQWRSEGVTKIYGLDDWDKVVKEMTELGIEAHQYGGEEKANFSFGLGNLESFPFRNVEQTNQRVRRVESLHQMTDVLSMTE